MPNLEDITAPEYIDIASGVEGASKKFSTEVDPDMSALLKSLASKNITLSQWNAAVTQLGLTVADVRRTYGILKKVAEDLDSNLAATNDVTADLISAVQKTYIELDAIAEDHEQRIADEETKSADHDKRLGDIEEYISDMSVEDKSAAYRKLVPEKSRKTAKVLSIGGMSYKSENLIPFPYDDTTGAGYTETKNGVTFAVLADGGISINGLCEKASSFTIARGINYFSEPIYIGTNKPSSVTKEGLCLSFNSTIPTADISIFYESSVRPWLYVYVKAGVTYNGVIYPMLNYGTTALPYKPYFAGLRHTKVTEIKSNGANLIPLPYFSKEGTYGGLTYTVNADGSVHVKGTATASTTFFLSRDMELPVGTTVTISGSIAGININARKYTRTGEDTTWFASANGAAASGELSEGEKVNFIGLYTKSGESVDATVYPMLKYGEEALPYKPYVGTLDTLTVPASMQAIDDYGVGVNADYHNYLEFVDGKVFFHKVCETLVFDGTENWLPSDTMTAGVWRCYLEHGLNALYKDTLTVSPTVCNKYEGRTTGNTYSKVRGLSVARRILYIYDENYNTSDISLWKAHLAELYASGDPLTAVVVLETPIVTDVTHLFSGDNVLKVQEGGYLTFESEHKYPVPSSIEWRIESSHKIAFEHSQTIGNPHRTTAAEVGAYSKEEADSKFILLEDGMVPSRMLPSYVDDVLEYSSRAAFPDYGESGKIYIDLFTNKSYRWSGTTYIELTSSELILGETSETAYRGDRGKIAYDHSQTTGNPHATTLGDILPVAEEDNDKILQVVGGTWTAVAIPNAEGGSF